MFLSIACCLKQQIRSLAVQFKAWQSPSLPLQLWIQLVAGPYRCFSL